MKDILRRQTYIEKISPYFGKDLIKVLIGQRRAGKSWILLDLIRILEKEYPEKNIIFIDKEEYEFSFIKTDKDLYDYIKSRMSDNNILLIDEVQEISNFEDVLRSLNNSGNFDIYITGSNADILSREISTKLAGRSIEINIYSLSYNEFLVFHDLNDNDDALDKYLRYGGLPYLRNLLLDDDVVFDYLKNIYQTILYRDIVSRHNLRNTAFLEQLVIYLADTLGSLITPKRISDFLKSRNVKTSPKTVIEYLSYLTESCFISKTPRWDIQGRRLLEINEKYYFGDTGLRNALIGFRAGDISKIIENVVYNHLCASGYQVRIGNIGDKEIDFVAEKQGEKSYFQVCYLLTGESVVEREFGNLELIPDHYPKYIISMDRGINNSRNGIRQICLRDFLRDFS